jgi:hypothetical protein
MGPLVARFKIEIPGLRLGQFVCSDFILSRLRKGDSIQPYNNMPFLRGTNLPRYIEQF